jgi:hypothetical protein
MGDRTARSWAHDELAADLMDARHCAGEIAIEKLGLYAGVVDVAAMRISWTKPRLTAYEVKISRADFLSDIRSGKWRKYLVSVERLYFAVPKGLVDLREVPSECGLTVRGARGWYTPRAAPRREIESRFHAGFVQSLLFRHYPAVWDGAHRVREIAFATATTPSCEKCPHPLGLHRHGICRRCGCYLENWRELMATQEAAHG